MMAQNALNLALFLPAEGYSPFGAHIFGRRTELLLTEFEGSLGWDWFFEFWCGPLKPSPFVAELRECRENRQQSRCGNKLQTSMRGLSVWERGAEKPIGRPVKAEARNGHFGGREAWSPNTLSDDATSTCIIARMTRR